MKTKITAKEIVAQGGPGEQEFFFPKPKKQLKVTFKVEEDADREGNQWYLTPVQVEKDGQVFTGDDAQSILQDAGVLTSGQRFIEIYNSNPAVYGWPERMITVGGQTLDVLDLLANSDEPLVLEL